jgi:hypothetical protein
MRRLRDAPDDFNKRMSKAQFLLATRRVEMEEGAVDDIDELRDEVARPDGIVVRRKGRALEIKDAVARRAAGTAGRARCPIHGIRQRRHRRKPRRQDQRDQRHCDPAPSGSGRHRHSRAV